MTGLTAEVLNALVRLMTGEIDYDELDDDALLAVMAMCAVNRKPLHEVAKRLNDRGRTFGQIAEQLKTEYGVDVHEATVARWAQPPGQDRRRRRGDTRE